MSLPSRPWKYLVVYTDAYQSELNVLLETPNLEEAEKYISENSKGMQDDEGLFIYERKIEVKQNAES